MTSASAADLREGGVWSERQRRKNDAIHAAIQVALVAVGALPPALVALSCRLLGVLLYGLLRRARGRVRARLSRGLGAVVRERDVLDAFVSAGALLADTLALLGRRERASRTLTMGDEARQIFRAALAEGRGVVFVTAHLGPWERMAALLVEEGFPVATVARESYDPRLTRLYERLRAPRGVRCIYRGRPGAARRVLRELSQGGAVGFLVDLPARVPALTVELFGQATAMPVGPAKIALARRAAVVVGTPGVDSEVVLSRVSTAALAADRAGVEELTHRLAAELTRRICATPKAWLGLYADPSASRAAPEARPGDESRSPEPPRPQCDPA